MHILFLTDNFPPEGNAPASRTFEHAKVWVSAGHKVTIITCAPNFPEGKVFSGYKNKWYQKEELDGIKVIRVKTYITANEGFLKRILDYQSFMVSSFFAGLLVKGPDVIVATSPQFFTVLSGWALAKLKRKRFIFELRDIWPASITAIGAMRKSRVINFFEKLEMFMYRQADKVIAVTHAFKQELITRGIEENKIAVVRNGVDLTKYTPRSKSDYLVQKYNLQGKFVIGYLGTHGMAHSLENVINAANYCKDKTEITFLFAGTGAALQQIKARAEELALDNVLILGQQDKNDMPDIWSLCDVSLVHLKNAKLFKTVIPSKIFESMGMGLPIIASIPKGEASDIVLENQAGIHVEPENPESLAQIVNALYQNKSLTNQLAMNSAEAASKYCRKKLAMDFLNHLN